MGESGIEQKDFIYFSEANTNKTEGLMNIEYDKEGLVGFLLGPLGELLGDILHALLGPLFDIPILGDLLAVLSVSGQMILLSWIRNLIKQRSKLSFSIRSKQ